MLLQSAILSVFNLANALHDSKRIKKHKRIYHGVNGAAYLLLVGLMIWWITLSDVAFTLHLGKRSLHVPAWLDSSLFAVSALLNRQISFDGILNRLRGLSFFYVSPSPKSKIDILEIKLFGKSGYIVTIIYLILWVITLGYQLCKQLTT